MFATPEMPADCRAFFDLATMRGLRRRRGETASQGHLSSKRLGGAHCTNQCGKWDIWKRSDLKGRCCYFEPRCGTARSAFELSLILFDMKIVPLFVSAYEIPWTMGGQLGGWRTLKKRVNPTTYRSCRCDWRSVYVQASALVGLSFLSISEICLDSVLSLLFG